MNTEHTEPTQREALDYFRSQPIPEHVSQMTEGDWMPAKMALQVFLFGGEEKDGMTATERAEKYGNQFNDFYNQFLREHPAMVYDWYKNALDDDADNDTELKDKWEKWKETHPEPMIM